MRSIFRTSVMERLSSPEQLDQVMQVTSPRGWLALAAVALLLATAVVWGFFGTIPTRVAGQGILIKRGGVFEVVAVSSGQLSSVTVNVGDRVKRGQIVATISQPELADNIADAKSQLRDLENQYRIVEKQGGEQLVLDLKALAREKANTLKTMDIRKKWIKSLEDRVAKEKTLLDKGLIGSESLLSGQDQLNQALSDQKNDENKVVALEAQVEDKRRQHIQEVAQSRQNLDQARDRLANLDDSSRLQSKIVSQADGRVLEVKLDQGRMIKAGQALLELEGTGPESAKLVAVGYFPPGDGKTISRGVKAQVLPDTVKAEEYGFMAGRVKAVSEFPATAQGMMRVLNNQELVQSLSQAGPPIEAEIELEPDAKTPSGYAWSSAQGPPVKITSGTLAQVTVITREQAPISLVMPMLRKYLLGVGADEPK